MKNFFKRLAYKKSPNTATLPRELDLTNLRKNNPVYNTMDKMRNSKLMRKLFGLTTATVALMGVSGCNWGEKDDVPAPGNSGDVPNPGGDTPDQVVKGAIQQEFVNPDGVELHPDGLNLKNIVYQSNDVVDGGEEEQRRSEEAKADDIHPGYNGPLTVQNNECVDVLILGEEVAGLESGEFLVEMQDGTMHQVSVDINYNEQTGQARLEVQDFIDEYNLDNPGNEIDANQIETLTTNIEGTLDIILSSSAGVSYNEATGNVEFGEKSAEFDEGKITQECTFTNGMTVKVKLTQLDTDGDGVGNLGDSLPEGVAVLGSVVDGQDSTMQFAVGSRNGENLLPAQVDAKIVWYDADGNETGEDLIPYQLQTSAIHNIDFQGPNTGFVAGKLVLLDNGAEVGSEEFNIWVDGDIDGDGIGDAEDYANTAPTVPAGSVGLNENFNVNHTINTPEGSAPASYVIISDSLTGETWQFAVQEGANQFPISLDTPGSHTLTVNTYDEDGNLLDSVNANSQVNAFNDNDADGVPDHLDYNTTPLTVNGPVVQGVGFDLPLDLDLTAGGSPVDSGVITVLKNGVPTGEIYNIAGLIDGPDTLQDLILQTTGDDISLQLELFAGGVNVDTKVSNTFTVLEDADGDGNPNTTDILTGDITVTGNGLEDQPFTVSLDVNTTNFPQAKFVQFDFSNGSDSIILPVTDGPDFSVVANMPGMTNITVSYLDENGFAIKDGDDQIITHQVDNVDIGAEYFPNGIPAPQNAVQGQEVDMTGLFEISHSADVSYLKVTFSNGASEVTINNLADLKFVIDKFGTGITMTITAYDASDNALDSATTPAFDVSEQDTDGDGVVDSADLVKDGATTSPDMVQPGSFATTTFTYTGDQEMIAVMRQNVSFRNNTISPDLHPLQWQAALAQGDGLYYETLGNIQPGETMNVYHFGDANWHNVEILFYPASSPVDANGVPTGDPSFIEDAGAYFEIETGVNDTDTDGDGVVDSADLVKDGATTTPDSVDVTNGEATTTTFTYTGTEPMMAVMSQNGAFYCNMVSANAIPPLWNNAETTIGDRKYYTLGTIQPNETINVYGRPRENGINNLNVKVHFYPLGSPVDANGVPTVDPTFTEDAGEYLDAAG